MYDDEESEWDKMYEKMRNEKAWNYAIGIVQIDALIKVYNSFLSPKIDDYNSTVYCENPSYLFESYRENKMLD